MTESTPTHFLVIRLSLVVAIVASYLGTPVRAQDAPRPAFASVERTLEQGDVDRAKELAESFLASEGETPAAYFQVARIYYEHDLLGDADRAIEKALKAEPSNIEFMELKLRIGFPYSFPIFIQRTKRANLAEKILEIDPMRPYPNEVLGLEFEELFETTFRQIRTPTSRLFQTGVNETSCARDGAGLKFNTDHHVVWNMGSCTNHDRFDIEMLKDLGIAIVDASAPAERAHERAVDHYEKAHKGDPDNVSIGESLLRLYIYKENYPAADQVLRRMFNYTSNTPAYWLYAGLIAYQIQDLESANAHFEQAKARMSPDYLDTFEDPARIRSPLEGNMAAEDYWRAKDVRYLTSFNERRVEHYFRMAYASLFFRSPDGTGDGWDMPRGRLLVRYGFPDRIYSITDTEEFLAELTDTNGDNQNSKNFQIWEFGQFRFVFEDAFKTGQFELWSPKAESATWYRNMDFVTMEKDRAIDTTEESELEEMLPRVEFPYLVNAFKGDGGKADIVVPYGIPLGQSEAAGPRMLPIQGGIFLVDSSAGAVAESRTGRGAHGMVYSFDQSVVWTSVLEMEGEAGSRDLSVEWETSDQSSMGFHRSAVTIPDFSGSDLSMSDLMLAYHVEEVDPGVASGGDGRSGQHQGRGITRKDLFIHPAPWGVFRAEQPVYVYFEAYNLDVRPDGSTRYDIDAQLIAEEERGRMGRIFGGRGSSAVSVRFNDSGSSRDIGRYLILDSTEQQPGTYRLVVRVHDAVTGTEVQSERTVILE